jgi:hypothetical protein
VTNSRHASSNASGLAKHGALIFWTALAQLVHGVVSSVLLFPFCRLALKTRLVEQQRYHALGFAVLLSALITGGSSGWTY